MNAIVSTVNPVTMTSLELVDYINSQRGEGEATLAHSDFLKKVPQVLGDGAGNFSFTYRDVQNKERPCYRFPKREACLMAMSYSYELQAKVFDRMSALEAAAAPALPSYTEALRQLADQIESNQALALERDHAIATKAQIGSRREATAMATAAAAKREAARLKDQLGFSARHATILQVEDAAGEDYDFVPLRRWCKAHEVTPETVPDKRYPKGVKAWPAAAWMDVYGVDLGALFAKDAGTAGGDVYAMGAGV